MRNGFEATDHAELERQLLRVFEVVTDKEAKQIPKMNISAFSKFVEQKEKLHKQVIFPATQTVRFFHLLFQWKPWFCRGERLRQRQGDSDSLF